MAVGLAREAGFIVAIVGVFGTVVLEVELAVVSVGLHVTEVVAVKVLLAGDQAFIVVFDHCFIVELLVVADAFKVAVVVFTVGKANNRENEEAES